MNIPSKKQVFRLVDDNPRTVISFANRLFRTEDFSQRELFEIANKLLKRVGEKDRIQLWEAATVMTQRGMTEAVEDWYHIAKLHLLTAGLSSFEYGAIGEFLNEQRMHFNASVLKEAELGSEFCRYAQINYFAMYAAPDRFKELFDLLSQSRENESVLIRSVVASAISILCSRSDVDEELLLPFRDQMNVILRQLSTDNHFYVIESVETARFFLEQSNLL